MKRWLYQVLVYVSIALFLVGGIFFIYEVATSGEFNSWAVVSLIVNLLGIVLFVVNRILYSLFKKRDPSKYETVECPYCHAINRKGELFCHKCGKELGNSKKP